MITSRSPTFHFDQMYHIYQFKGNDIHLYAYAYKVRL